MKRLLKYGVVGLGIGASLLLLAYSYMLYISLRFADDYGRSGVHLADMSVTGKRPRCYSPDHSKVLVFYGIGGGAWDGDHDVSVAVLQKEDLKGEIGQFSIPGYEWDDVFWKGNDTVVLCEKYSEFVRSGRSHYKDSVFLLNSILVHVVQKDPLDSTYIRKVLHESTSPDGLLTAVLYRYVKEESIESELNLSIIHKGQALPKYGNFFISKYGFDCVKGIKWTESSTLVIDASSGCYYAFNSFLVHNRPDIPFVVREKE